MGDEYYDIEAILAENQKVQCTFKVDVPDMGHLAGGEDRDIKATSKLQIPMWMAYILIYSDYADFNIPHPFSSRVRNALNAEARSVKLTSLVGQGGMCLNDDPAVEMSNVLVKTFRARLTEIIDQAQHFASIGASTAGNSGDQGMAFREGLDGTERELFALAQWSVKMMKRWHESSETSKR
ncbi:GINS complex, Psf3 component [Cristinia sonorae]|uniref:DNA replication complex GINS protein PSF3 n=1 Tax=Cristinia sonorae TaxID=1940300 RepID=A0A8K0XTM5_9AGAR|nr:GINS complex, Psf3 component [Cristinia sonorae]